MRKVSLLILMVGLLVMGGVVSAQDTMPVFCGSLAQADCTILQQSRTAMQGLKSADISLNFSFSAENVPNMPSTEPITVTVTGTGSFAGDMSALGQPPTSTTDPAAAMAYVSKALSSFSGKLNLTINIPPALTQMSQSSGTTIPSTIPINIVLVDGKGYIDMDALAPVIEASSSSESTPPALPKGWVGIDVVEALNQMAPMMTQMSSMATEEAAASGMMSQFMDPAFIGKYLTVERGADANGAAVFNTTVNIAGLLNDPAVQSEISKQAATSGSSQAQQGIAMMTMMASSMKLSASTQVGLSDNFVHGASVDFTFDMTSLMQAMASQATAEASPSAPPVIKVHFDYALSNFNSAQPITVPEGATLIPLSQLMGGGMSGGMDTTMEGLNTDMSGLDTMMQGMDSMMPTQASSG